MCEMSTARPVRRRARRTLVNVPARLSRPQRRPTCTYLPANATGRAGEHLESFTHRVHRPFRLPCTAKGKARLARSGRCLPESVDRKCAQAVAEGERLLPRIEDVPGDEAIAKASGEVA